MPIKHEVEREIGTFSQHGDYQKRVRLVSWNDRIPVIDVRSWRGDKPLKGITMTRNEAQKLLQILQENL